MLPELLVSWLIVCGILAVVAYRLDDERPLRGLPWILGGAALLQLLFMTARAATLASAAAKPLPNLVIPLVIALILTIPSGFLGTRLLISLKAKGVGTIGAFAITAVLVAVLSAVALTVLGFLAFMTIGARG